MIQIRTDEIVQKFTANVAINKPYLLPVRVKDYLISQRCQIGDNYFIHKGTEYKYVVLHTNDTTFKTQVFFCTNFDYNPAHIRHIVSARHAIDNIPNWPKWLSKTMDSPHISINHQTNKIDCFLKELNTSVAVGDCFCYNPNTDTATITNLSDFQSWACIEE